MTTTLARINKTGKHFEIHVDMEQALAFRKGEVSSIEAEGDQIFTDLKKGERASHADLEAAFKTTDPVEIAKIIVKQGEVQVTQEHRNAEQERRFKQVVDFLATNAIDVQTKNHITPERIKSALEQARVNIKPVAIESQIKSILDALSSVLPIKLDTKKVKIIVPAVHTGRAYGIVAQYKTAERWLDNGDLEVIVEVPSGIIMDFYEKLNNVTHGSALTEEVKAA